MHNKLLVDPDNRVPVDFVRRAQALAQLENVPASTDQARGLLEAMEDGRIKLYLIWKTLSLRQARQELFRAGEYLPMRTGGKQAARLCAYARRLGEHMVVAVAPRLLASQDADPPLGAIWADTWIEVPKGGSWSNVFTGQTMSTGERSGGLAVFSAARLLSDFPCALLVFDQETNTDPAAAA